MKERLFKGKRKDTGEWTEGYFFKIWDRVFLLWGMTGDSPNMEEVIPETVGQYTGLLDKHGNKIFEDDIIKVNITQAEDRKTYGDCAYKIGVIVYNEDFALFTCKNNFMNFTNWAFNDYEVIGNFHDNKELLGE